MPPKDADKIKNTVIYIDGKPIGKVAEITLPEIELERQKTIKDRVIGVMADIVTAVCSGITNFLLWIQRKGR